VGEAGWAVPAPGGKLVEVDMGNSGRGGGWGGGRAVLVGVSNTSEGKVGGGGGGGCKQIEAGWRGGNE